MTLQDAIRSFDVLRLGSSGKQVKMLQAMLCSYSMQMKETLRAAGGIDGSFGSSTESCVKMFQRDVALEQDGVVGWKTWNVLAIKTQDTNITNAENGRWYQLTSPYAFSVKYVGSSIGTVNSSSKWYYFDPFSSQTATYKKFVELGSLI